LRSVSRAAQRLVGVAAVFLQVGDEVAVLVPGFMEELDEADPLLDEAAGEQAVVGERRLAGLGPVHGQRSWLLREVHQLRGTRLHAVGHLERADAGRDFRVADRAEPFSLSVRRGVERVPLGLAVDPRRAAEEQPPARRRCGTAPPLWAVGRKPLPQFDEPPLVPFLPELKTTKPGKSCDSLPRP